MEKFNKLNSNDNNLLRLYQNRHQLVIELRQLEKSNQKWINIEGKKKLSEPFLMLIKRLELVLIQIKGLKIDDNSLGSTGELLGYASLANPSESSLFKVDSIIRDINYNDSMKTLVRRVSAAKQTTVDLEMDLNDYWSIIVAQEMLLLGERYLYDHPEEQILRNMIIDIKYELANLYPFMENALMANNFEIVHPCVFSSQTLYTILERIPFKNKIYQQEMLRQIEATSLFSVQRIIGTHLNDALHLDLEANKYGRQLAIINTLTMEAALRLLPKKMINLEFLAYKTMTTSSLYAGCYNDVEDIVTMINNLFATVLDEETPNNSHKQKRFEN